MVKENTKKNKHLTPEDRKEIEECLSKRMTFKAIGKLISKDPTTISYEIKHHRNEYRNSFVTEDSTCPFRIDEHNTPQITGPFRRQGIVYACALMLHQTAGIEEYRFSEEEKSIFIHNHYSSREELPIDQE